MNLTPDQNLALRRFCQEITYKPRALDSQPCERVGIYIWCEDWETIEIVKYLFLGEAAYFAEAPPRRLRSNPLWSKENIRGQANTLMLEFSDNIDHVIEFLRARRAKDGTPRVA